MILIIGLCGLLLGIALLGLFRTSTIEEYAKSDSPLVWIAVATAITLVGAVVELTK